MNLLLDTHILLWWLADDSRLNVQHRELLSDTKHLCYISSATIWEISIKTHLGKLTIPDTYLDEVRNQGFLELPVMWKHAAKIAGLPEIHRDPFDRLLVAQAQVEKLILLTEDPNIHKYGIRWL
jgi:PIN domain nuclease of toxin-antitoxin system